MTHPSKLPRKAFYAVKARDNWSTPVECAYLVLLPPQSTRLHDSGYRLMDAVAFGRDDQPICRVSGCSDVFNLERPSNIWTKERTPQHASSWGIDCLARSGLFRIFLFDADIQVEGALSSLYIHPIARALA